MKKIYTYKPLYGDCSVFSTAHETDFIAYELINGGTVFYDKAEDIGLLDGLSLLAVRDVIETYMWEDFDRIHKIQPHIGTIAAAKSFDTSSVFKIEVIGFCDVSNQVYGRHDNGFIDTYDINELYPYESPDEIKKRSENEFINAKMREMGIGMSSISYQIVKSAIRNTYRTLKGIVDD